MPFCASCGADVQGRFCAKCGTPVGEQAGSTPPLPSGQLSAPGLQENVAAALCYLAGVITGILFLVLAPYNQNRNIRFHAWQSILTHVVFLVLFVGVIPLLPHVIARSLGPLCGLGGFVLWLAMIWKAYNNQRLVIPVISDFAEKQA